MCSHEAYLPHLWISILISLHLLAFPLDSWDSAPLFPRVLSASKILPNHWPINFLLTKRATHLHGVHKYYSTVVSDTQNILRFEPWLLVYNGLEIVINIIQDQFLNYGILDYWVFHLSTSNMKPSDITLYVPIPYSFIELLWIPMKHNPI